MALDFPSSPTNGQTYGNYYYDATVGAWNSFSSTVNPIPSTLKNLSVTTDDIGLVPLTVNGASGQTANLQEWKNSAGSGVASMTNAGTLTVQTLNLTNDLTVANGGTGAGTFTTGAYLKGNGTSAIQAQTGIPFADVTMQSIGAGADLNTYVTQGLYHQGSNAQAAGGTNYPVAYAGLLEVFQSGVDGSGFTYQRYTVYQGFFQVYTRAKYTTTWSAWKLIPFNDSPTFTGTATAPVLASTIATGTAPLTVSSTTTVSNLNADMIDGYHESAMLLTRSTGVSTNSTDFNTIVTPGSYGVGGNGNWTGSSNAPTSAYAYGQLVVTANGNIVSQIYYTHNVSGHYIRTKYNASDWQAWQRIATDYTSARVARLVTTTAQSTSGTAGAASYYQWTSDTMSSGMWSSGANTKIFPNKAGKWRVNAKVRFAATSGAAGYVQVQMNRVSNSPSEGLQTDSIGGAYPSAMDIFNVTAVGTDYFETAFFSTGITHGTTQGNAIMTAEYLGT